MTPCEELGYKVGDRFLVLETSTFQKGAIVELYRDDGTACPLFKGNETKYKLCDGAPGAFIPLKKVQKLHPIMALIQKRDKQAEKVKRQTDKLDRLNEEIKQAITQLESEVERDTGLRCNIYEDGADGTPDGVDVDDPSTWRAGDVIECVSSQERYVTIGKRYVYTGETNSIGGPVLEKDDDGDKFSPVAKYKFISRPA